MKGNGMFGRMRTLAARLRQSVAKPVSWALVAALTGAFAFVMIQASLAGRVHPLTPGISGEINAGGTHATTTVPYSPPTPTPGANLPGGPVPTANNNGPLTVTSLSVAPYGHEQPEAPI
jgi:hypothetical protein